MSSLFDDKELIYFPLNKPKLLDLMIFVDKIIKEDYHNFINNFLIYSYG